MNTSKPHTFWTRIGGDVYAKQSSMGSIPVNAIGACALDHGPDEDSNIIDYQITEDEYTELFKSGLIPYINKNFQLLIDEYETEIIPYQKAEKILEILNGTKFWDYAFAKSLRDAVKHKTHVECDL